MKKSLIVANWKMNLNTHEASLLVKRFDDNIEMHRDVEVVIAPSFLTLQPISVQIDRRKFKLASQDGYLVDQGAYTGEVSFTMLRDLVHYSIIGHSERRIYFNETLEVVRDKVQAAIRNEINPILCVGETKHERSAGETKRVIHDQITTALSNLTPEEVENISIAYEPVWAIGTGKTATPQDAQAVHRFLRQLIATHNKNIAEKICILYGGSVKADNAASLFTMPDIDGALVGGASLVASDFLAICHAAKASIVG